MTTQQERFLRFSSAVLRRALVLALVGMAPSPAVGTSTMVYAQQLAAITPLVFDGVTVVDIQQGHLLLAQRVVIVGNRIRTMGSVGTVQILTGARVVNAKGMYMIPGLWDMHAHVDDHVDFLYPSFIANGVTGLREMAQRFPFGADSFRVWQRQIAVGARVGPRVFGPSADLTYEVSVNTPEDARRVIDSVKAAGDVFIKQHKDAQSADPADRMPRDLYFAIAAEARRVGIPMVGHVPLSVTEIEASDSGQKSVEHVEQNHTCWSNWPQPLDSLAEQRCAPVAAAYIRNGTWMVPTLVGANYYPEHNVSEAQRFVRMMHRFGVVHMLAGTDFGIDMMEQEPHFLPGVSLLDEVVYLAGAGLTPLEALQAATLNPAIFFNATDSLGTIAQGKLADLVLLTANPLTNIENVRKIHAVVANGRYFDRAALDQLVAAVQTK